MTTETLQNAKVVFTRKVARRQGGFAGEGEAAYTAAGCGERGAPRAAVGEGGEGVRL